MAEHELVKLQSEITREISRDAPHIAAGVFGEAKTHPDVASVSNQQLDDVYRQKFLNEDRAWLQAEARRDPEQFLKVAQRIGARIPPPPPPQPTAGVPGAFALGPTPAPPPAMPPSLPAPAPVPMVAPAPLAPPQLVAPSAPPPGPAPVILGPNGQPLVLGPG